MEIFVILAKPCIVLGENCTLLSEGYLLLGEGCIVLEEGCVVLGEGCALLGEACVVLGEAYVVLGDVNFTMKNKTCTCLEARGSRCGQGFLRIVAFRAHDGINNVFTMLFSFPPLLSSS